MENDPMNAAQEVVDPRFGELRFAWSMDEYRPGERGPWWYVVFGTFSVGLVAWSVFTANYAFSVLVVLFALFFILDRERAPRKTPVAILSTGLAVGEEFHSWRDVREFSVLYDPPQVRHVYVFFQGNWRPPLSLLLGEDVNPNDVRALLKEYAVENIDMDKPLMDDRLKLRYKL